LTEPMYRQIAEDLRNKIESGELPSDPRVPLPTEIDLRKRYGASRNTVRDAIRWLIARGLVETRPGQGTFVAEKPIPFVATLTAEPGADEVYIPGAAESLRRPEASISRVEIQQAGKVVADALRIEEGAPVVSRHYQHYIDRAPWSLQTSFYPMSLVEQGATRLLQATDIERGAVAYLAEERGIKQVGYRDSIAVRQPDEAETAFFKLPADGRVRVFEVFRIDFTETGDRIRLTTNVYRVDRSRLQINVGLVPASGPGGGSDAGHVTPIQSLAPAHAS
jgi:GntR family transcriptional regulator